MGLVDRVKAAVGGLLNDLYMQVTPELPLWAQFQRIGGGVSPQTVSEILREADIGQIGRFVDLVHESRQKDLHLHSVLQTRELAIQGLEWDVVPPTEEPSEEEKAAAALFKRALRRCPTFPTAIGHCIGESLLFAFAYNEIVWKVEEEDPELKGMMVPDRFVPVSCRRFGFTTDEGQLRFNPSVVWGNVDTDGIDLDEAYAQGKWLRMKDRRVNGDVASREGLGRALLWAAIFRNWDIGDWLKLGELAWKPHRVAKYQKSASPKDIEDLKTALRVLEATQRTVLPETVELVMQWAQNGVRGMETVHHDLAEFLGMEMSKGVLGGTLTVESGSKGARSLGEVHDEVRKDRAEADTIEMASGVQWGLTAPFYALNYGTRYQLPQWFMLTEDPVDLNAFSEAIERFRNAGLRIPASYVRDRAGMPEPKADEEVLGEGEDQDDGDEDGKPQDEGDGEE